MRNEKPPARRRASRRRPSPLASPPARTPPRPRSPPSGRAAGQPRKREERGGARAGRRRAPRRASPPSAGSWPARRRRRRPRRKQGISSSSPSGPSSHPSLSKTIVAIGGRDSGGLGAAAGAEGDRAEGPKEVERSRRRRRRRRRRRCRQRRRRRLHGEEAVDPARGSGGVRDRVQQQSRVRIVGRESGQDSASSSREATKEEERRRRKGTEEKTRECGGRRRRRPCPRPRSERALQLQRHRRGGQDEPGLLLLFRGLLRVRRRLPGDPANAVRGLVRGRRSRRRGRGSFFPSRLREPDAAEGEAPSAGVPAPRDDGQLPLVLAAVDVAGAGPGDRGQRDSRRTR